MNIRKNKISSFLTGSLVIGALMLASIGSAALADDTTTTTTPQDTSSGDVTVTILGYVDGQMATAATAQNLDFPMTASWTADNIGTGTGSYALSASDPTPYQAVTAEMSSGAAYSTNEVMDGTIVGATCGTGSTDPSYTLAGYTTGDTMADAAAATPSMTVPNLTDLTTNTYVIVWNTTCAPQTTTAPTVTVAGYVNGSLATQASTNNATFGMDATWNDINVNSGTNQEYFLSSTGFKISTPYEASTGDLTPGSSFATNEVMDGTTVGATCSTTGTTPAYTLAGYSTGDTLAAAAAATPTMTVPSFTNLTAPEFVIVWNTSCAPQTTTPPETLQVHIVGYLDNAQATAATANNYLFPMTATWQTANLNNGNPASGTYSLGDNSNTADLYEADTVAFDAPASYSTAEVTDNTSNVLPIGAPCVDGKYELDGYKTSTISFADAVQNGTLMTTAPSFTNINADQYVIVLNSTCGTQSGTVGGTVTGGIEPGALAVTGVTTVNGTAIADGTFADGWKYTFDITVPDSETHLAMKFDDWMNTANESTIPAANNIQISSMQADNNDAPITISAANTYSTPELNITGDLDPTMPGKQIQVTVEVAVPTNSLNGSYTTNYGVQSLAQ